MLDKSRVPEQKLTARLKPPHHLAHNGAVNETRSMGRVNPTSGGLALAIEEEMPPKLLRPFGLRARLLTYCTAAGK